MTEQTSLANFFTVLFSAAMAIMLGALYVLLPAFARVRDDPRLMPCLAYAGLLAATLFLADAANPLEHPAWAAIVAFLLAGYLPAPARSLASVRDYPCRKAEKRRDDNVPELLTLYKGEHRGDKSVLGIRTILAQDAPSGGREVH